MIILLCKLIYANIASAVSCITEVPTTTPTIEESSMDKWSESEFDYHLYAQEYGDGLLELTRDRVDLMTAPFDALTQHSLEALMDDFQQHLKRMRLRIRLCLGLNTRGGQVKLARLRRDVACLELALEMFNKFLPRIDKDRVRYPTLDFTAMNVLTGLLKLMHKTETREEGDND